MKQDVRWQHKCLGLASQFNANKSFIATHNGDLFSLECSIIGKIVTPENGSTARFNFMLELAALGQSKFQELELRKNKVLAKVNFTHSANKLMIYNEELDGQEIQDAYTKMKSCFKQL